MSEVLSEAKVLTRVEPSDRLMSLDALRGFDMFWIVGAESLVRGLEKLGHSPGVEFVANQLKHKRWEGIAFEDLIFPLFVFMSGISIAFSLGKSVEQKGRWGTVGKIALRALLLFGIGIFYSGGLKTAWPDIRLLGVLQRIALSYLFAGTIFCFFGLRGRVVSLIVILVGYWALMTFVPIPEDAGIVSRRKPAADEAPFPARFDEGTNLANYVDRHYLPGRRYDWSSKQNPLGDHDPEGLLSTIPAIATSLLGVLAGMLLKNSNVQPTRKALLLLGAGIVCIGLGYLWGLQFPIVKKLWTSSYVLVAGGWAMILLSVFYAVIDVLKWQKWSLPFVWIGTNALVIYLSSVCFKFGEIASRFVGGDAVVETRFGIYGPLVQAIASLGVLLLFANFLYRRKIFIRI